jgi:hypothetical protein
MKISVYNDGDNPIRVIIDGDESDDLMLESGEEQFVESRETGVIELRELDGPQAESPAD